jgi:murein DD-endopeptidase MepM/ murein hydrolase activator NlpD
MPHQSGQHRPTHHHRPAAHATHRRAATATTGPADYTLAHAGRQLRIGPIAFWVVVGTLVIMAVWTVTTATYFAFRDDVLTRLIARQAEMQFGYEDRIAELRAQVDRISSRQLLDQDQFEQKLEQVQRRQSTLESRAAMLSTLPEHGATGSVRPSGRTDPARSGLSRSSALHDVPAAPGSRPRKAAAITMEKTLAHLQASLDRVEHGQAKTLHSLAESYDAKARRIRGVLSGIGIDAGKAPAAGRNGTTATGGPFIPVPTGTDSGAFERQVQRISIARADVDKLTRTLVAVPLRKPIAGELEVSSGFGVRVDPFVRSAAMHTGLDFRAGTGDPVRATANGTVETAGWTGGYGKMIEIDHGNDLATRYGHLSVIEVKVGQAVKAGQIIGRVGSTGRSTGPHLHYETRVDGDAVDPHKFLRAGDALGLFH